MTLAELLAALAKGEIPEGVDIQALINKAISDAKTEAGTGLSTLQEKNQAMLDQIKKLKNSQLPDGFDMTAYEELLKAQEDIDLDKLKGEERWDELKNQLVKKHEDKMAKLQERTDSLISMMQNNTMDAIVTTSINEEKGNVVLLTPHVKSLLGVTENEDGSFTTFVKDDNGQPRIDIETGKAFTVSQLVKEMKTKDVFSNAFMVNNSGGGGGTGGNGRNAHNPFLKLVGDKENPHYSLTDQVKMMKADPELAKQMKIASQEV